AVGIGISTAAQVQTVNSYADAAIVGSAIVKAHQTGGVKALTELVSDLAQGAKTAIKEN
ncbi:MAG: Tryptophan synthase alpha chain, partial [Actinomycetota bacterium]